MSESKRILRVVCFDQTFEVFRQIVRLGPARDLERYFCKSQFEVRCDSEIVTPFTQGIIKWRNSTP